MPSLTAGSLTVAELACRVPQNGAIYAYLRAGIGSWIAFVYVWFFILVTAPSSVAVKSLTFSRYFTSTLKMCGMPELPVHVTAVTLIRESSTQANVAFSPAPSFRLQLPSPTTAITGYVIGLQKLSANFRWCTKMRVPSSHETESSLTPVASGVSYSVTRPVFTRVLRLYNYIESTVLRPNFVSLIPLRLSFLFKKVVACEPVL